MCWGVGGGVGRSVREGVGRSVGGDVGGEGKCGELQHFSPHLPSPNTLFHSTHYPTPISTSSLTYPHTPTHFLTPPPLPHTLTPSYPTLSFKNCILLTVQLCYTNALLSLAH